MREILFKAKTTKKEDSALQFNNVWVKGDLICSNNKYYIHPKGNVVRVDGELGKIIVMHEVDPSTICQCTGLKDKNGKLIWENDVVKCVDVNAETEFFAVVEFGNPNGFYSWGYQLKHIWGDEPNLDILLWIDMEEAGATCEIIGNIFDEGSE